MLFSEGYLDLSVALRFYWH